MIPRVRLNESRRIRPSGNALTKQWTTSCGRQIWFASSVRGQCATLPLRFSTHFARRLRHVLATLPANDNPYLWQMLKGCYPPGSMAPWLSRVGPARNPSVASEADTMVGALADRPREFDFVHLSNILDWLDPEDARTTLDLARRALRPGGWTLVRQLNSTLDIERLGDGFEWHAAEARRMHQADRSFFYRALYLGRRR